MAYVVTEACIKCKYMDCVEVCPVDCFYVGENMLVIHPDECIDCGVCEPECPAEAILPDTETGTDKWLEINRAIRRRMAEHHPEGRSARPMPMSGRVSPTNSPSISTRHPAKPDYWDWRPDRGVNAKRKSLFSVSFLSFSPSALCRACDSRFGCPSRARRYTRWLRSGRPQVRVAHNCLSLNSSPIFAINPGTGRWGGIRWKD